MSIKPIDIALAALINIHPSPLSFDEMADNLAVSKSTAHDSAVRAREIGLLNQELEARPIALHEALVHVAKYIAPAKLGVEVRGVLTGPTCFPEDPAQLAQDLWAWPSSTGEIRGKQVDPIFPAVPSIASANPQFHQLFAAADLIRCGNARERAAGIKILDQLLLDQ